jgi:hypothetical protein
VIVSRIVTLIDGLILSVAAESEDGTLNEFQTFTLQHTAQDLLGFSS